VCENNLYNEYTHYQETTAGEILDRPRAFGIEAREVDGQDVRGVFAHADELVARARAGHGPAFLLANTYRYHGHHVGDVDRSYYRSKEEEELWRSEQRDPLALHAKWLIAEGVADEKVLRAIDDEVVAEIEEALRFALEAPYPDPSEVAEDVFA
jgi:pyruvate dehydrogenase E1 component alpha subunit